MGRRYPRLAVASALLILGGLAGMPAFSADHPVVARGASLAPLTTGPRTPCLPPAPTVPPTATAVPPTPAGPTPTVVPPRQPPPTYAPPPSTATPLGAWGPGASTPSAPATVRVLCVSPINGYPYAIAVDQTTARAFVLTMASPDPTMGGAGSVSVLDAATGDVLGATAVGLNPRSITLDERAGRVFVLNAGPPNASRDFRGPGSVSVLDATTGALVATVPLPVSPTSLMLAVQAGRVFVYTPVATGRKGALYVLDATTGALLRTTYMHMNPWVQIDQRTGRVYVTNEPYRDLVTRKNVRSSISVLDAATGRLVRSLPFGPQDQLLAVNSQAGRLFVYTPDPSRLRVLDAATGALLRTIRLGTGFGGGLALDAATNHVFVVTVGNYLNPRARVSVLNATTGQLLRTLANLPPGGLTINTDVRRAFVSGQEDVSVLDTATATVVRIVHLGEYPGQPLVDRASNRVFIANSKQDVIQVLDLTTGALVDVAPVGHSPHGMAVDERTGRLFVSVSFSRIVKILDAGSAHSAAAQPSPARPSRT